MTESTRELPAMGNTDRVCVVGGGGGGGRRFGG